MMEAITLTSPEMYAAKAVAFQIQLGKEKSGVSNARICKRDDLAINLEGQLGEVAVCKHLGLNYCPDIHASGDGGVDYRYRGSSLQIKSTQTRYLLFPKKENMICDYAILTAASKDKNNLVYLQGWIDHDTWHSTCEPMEFIQGVRSYGVHARNLKPMKELDEIITKCNKTK